MEIYLAFYSIMNANLDKYIFTTKIQRLYHSTVIRNDKSKEYFEELIFDDSYLPLPPIGGFSTRLDIQKYFTVTSECCYISDDDWIYLEYYPIKPLRLFNLLQHEADNKEYYDSMRWSESWLIKCDFRNNLWKRAEELGIDGFMDKEDCIEICLFKANECVDTEFSMLELPDREHNCGYNLERELKAVDLKLDFTPIDNE